jgi:DNA-binding HxlR family transcriptional regulator
MLTPIPAPKATAEGSGDDPPLMRNCSVARTLEILSDAWSFLVLREFYLGARRFDQVQAVLQIPRSTLSDRLSRLTDAAIVARVACSEGAARFEYRLTDKGLDLYLVMLALLRFGDDHLAGDHQPPLQLVHAGCGNACRPETICSACRNPIDPLGVTYRDGPGAGLSPVRPQPQRRRTSGTAAFERGRPSSVSRTLGILADRWSFLLLREAFFGVKRFDRLQAALGIAPNILADRLNRLVDRGILKRAKYQDHPERFEYKLSAIGRDLYFPLIQMLRWGDRWQSASPPLILTHRDCGSDFVPVLACDHCHEPLEPYGMRYRLAYEPPAGLRTAALLSGTHGLGEPTFSSGGACGAGRVAYPSEMEDL